MKNALAKLEAALLIHRALPTSSLALPLRERPRSAAKLLPLDVGLALYTMGSGFETMRGLPLGQVLDGRIAEIFAGQQLLASAPGFPGELFFWVSESSHSNAEVDYLIPIAGQPVPVEVKSAAHRADARRRSRLSAPLAAYLPRREATGSGDRGEMGA